MVWDSACVPSAPPTRYEQGGVCRRGQQIGLVHPGSRPLAQLARGGTNWERNSVTRLRVSDEGLCSDAVVPPAGLEPARP